MSRYIADIYIYNICIYIYIYIYIYFKKITVICGNLCYKCRKILVELKYVSNLCVNL